MKFKLLNPAQTTSATIKILTAAAMVLFAMWPAFYNGYPLLFPDSTAYLWLADDTINASNAMTGYNMYYPWFIAPTLAIKTLWIVPFLQSLVALFILSIFFGSFAFKPNFKVKVGYIAFTLAITQLPWLVAWAMPDVFAGLGFLALCLLLFPQEKKLSSRIAACLIVVAIFGALMSVGNLLAYVASAAGVYLFKFVTANKLPIPSLSNALILLYLTLGLAFLPNYLLYGKLDANVGSSALIFARFVDVGLAQDYLHENCDEPAYLICDEIDKLDAMKGKRQAFLWGEDRLADNTEAWHDPYEDLKRINRAIILSNISGTIIHVAQSAANLLILSSLSDPEDDNNFKVYPESDPVWKFIHGGLPNDAAAFDSSLQQQGAFHRTLWNNFYFASQYLSYMLIVVATFWAIKVRNWLVLSILGCSVIYLLVSAAIHAGLVGPFVRYQVKAAWVLWPVALAALSHLVNARTGEPATH